MIKEVICICLLQILLFNFALLASEHGFKAEFQGGKLCSEERVKLGTIREALKMFFNPILSGVFGSYKFRC